MEPYIAQLVARDRRRYSLIELALCGESILTFLDSISLGSLTGALVTLEKQSQSSDISRCSLLTSLLASVHVRSARSWLSAVDTSESSHRAAATEEDCMRPRSTPLLFDLPIVRGDIHSWSEIYDESVSWAAMWQVAESEGVTLVAESVLFSQLRALLSAEDSATSSTFPHLCL